VEKYSVSDYHSFNELVKSMVSSEGFSSQHRSNPYSLRSLFYNLDGELTYGFTGSTIDGFYEVGGTSFLWVILDEYQLHNLQKLCGRVPLYANGKDWKK